MSVRQQFSADAHRPQYHFTAPQYWMNDPNGLIQWQGVYHLFYQYNPHAAYWGAMHWGHATSTDLVHWHDEPIALAPDMPYDADGVFSGCAIVHEGRPVLMYTGVSSPHQLPCVAYPDAEMRHFHKEPSNPVIRTLPDNLVYDFRDHTMWHDGEFWYQVLGSGDGVRAVAPLFRSRDLLDWEYLGRMIQSDDTTHEQLYECPDFFASNGKHVFITSPLPMRRVIWMSGDFDGRTFVPAQRNMVDIGASFYAPQSFTDEQGRRIMIGWCQEQRHDSTCRSAGWQGAMTLPRIVELDADGALTFTVAPEVTALEGTTHTHLHHAHIDTVAHALQHIASDTVVIKTRLHAARDASVTLIVRADPQTGEHTSITWNRQSNELRCDMSASSLSQATSHDCYTAALHASVQDTLDLHIYVDRSVIEIYAGQHTVCTLRVYPVGTAQRFGIHAHGDIHASEFVVREMQGNNY